ncbi:MAG: 5'-methylthioadenosine/adenosylhomocysteine nucleosidase [Oscillospiraceae bacterium]
MNKLGIMGAMPDETAILYDKMQHGYKEKIGGVDFYVGTLENHEVVLCCAGMGKVNAAAAAQLLCTHFNADAVIFSGIAGNMTSRISVGDVVISSSALYHDAENRMLAECYPHKQEFMADAVLISAAERACDELQVKYITGRIATGDTFIGDSVTKKRIADAFAPACVEMEGAAVAHIACKNDKPFVIIRAMSDDANEEGAEKIVNKTFDMSEYVKTATEICVKIIANL